MEEVTKTALQIALSLNEFVQLATAQITVSRRKEIHLPRRIPNGILGGGIIMIRSDDELKLSNKPS